MAPRFSNLDIVCFVEDGPKGLTPAPPRRRTKARKTQWKIIACKNGKKYPITLARGTNSFGSPDIFAGKRPARGRKEFAPLRGYPLYDIQTWLVGNGYTYEVV